MSLSDSDKQKLKETILRELPTPKASGKATVIRKADKEKS